MPFRKTELLSTHQFHLGGLLGHDKWFVFLVFIVVALGSGALAIGVRDPATGFQSAGLLFLALALACLGPSLHGFFCRPGRVKVYESGLWWKTLGGEQECAWDE